MRVYIDKDKVNQKGEVRKELDELYKDLQAEESCCNGCYHQYDVSIDYCCGCGTYGNIKDIENSIRELLEV